MSSPDGRHEIRPDMRVRLRETGRDFRLGLIVSDKQRVFWGLTARYVFGDLLKGTIATQDGQPFASYDSEASHAAFDADHAAALVCKVRIDHNRMIPANIEMGVVWPRTLIDEHETLGAMIVTVTAHETEIGEVVETNTVAKLGVGQGAPHWIHGATIVNIDSDRVLPKGDAGTLVISETAEVVGLALGSIQKDSRTDLVVCPLGDYLSKNDLKLWTPPAAHWSDLRNRVNVFTRRVDADHGPDLGPIPSSDMRRR